MRSSGSATVAEKGTVVGSRNSIIILSLTAFAPACGGQSSTGNAKTASGTPSCGSVPHYATDVRPLVDRACVQCHQPGGKAGEEHDFRGYEKLSAQREKVADVLEEREMPPRGSPAPSDAEREIVMRWARCGAPQQ